MAARLDRAALALVLSCLACEAGDDRESAARTVSPRAAPAAVPDSAPRAGSAAQPAAVVVTIRYEHVMTCRRFLGREGQFFVYRFVTAENRGDTAVVLDPMHVRIGGPAGDIPSFQVPERGVGEIPPHEIVEAEEQVLLQRGGSGRPPRRPVPPGYAIAGVEMVREGAEPAYDEGSGCDGFNT
ncbi:MAG TPA: hypothetical protein VFQ45_04335 [Longimicrobium sp.]|nr:hypothetical protein [Longimicrobium sp.]